MAGASGKKAEIPSDSHPPKEQKKQAKNLSERPSGSDAERQKQKEQMKGHRDRLRKRCVESGMDSLSDHEVLELLLFYAIPYKDTKPMAKDLIDHFGTLHDVLEASIEDLMDAGLTRNTAILLTLIPEVDRRRERSRNSNQTKILSTADAGKYICAEFRNQTDESVRIFCLNAAGKVVKNVEIAKGDVNAVHFPIRKIIENALNYKAVSIILAHNHPGGTLHPSREDIDASHAAAEALELVGIRLLDHLIVSGDDYCSLREDGYL